MVVAIWKTHRQRPEIEGSNPFDYENNRLTMKELCKEFFHCQILRILLHPGKEQALRPRSRRSGG